MKTDSKKDLVPNLPDSGADFLPDFADELEMAPMMPGEIYTHIEFPLRSAGQPIPVYRKPATGEPTPEFVPILDDTFLDD